MKTKTYILFSVLTVVVGFSAYYYAYNKGAREEREFMRILLVPLCDAMTSTKADLVDCIVGNL